MLSLLTVAAVLTGPDPLVLADFDQGPPTTAWMVVNDNVMGGRSTGGPKYEDGTLVFSGFINTNGGGFSSLRSEPGEWDLSEYDAIRLRVRGDDRTYRVDVRTDVWYGRRRVAYQAEFTAPEREWGEVTLRLSDFFPTVWGEDITGLVEPLDAGDIRGIGLILNDGVHGPFELHVDHIEAVTLGDAAASPAGGEDYGRRLDDLLTALGIEAGGAGH